MAANYKCTSIGCYYQDAATSTLFKKLQNTINQFAQAQTFSPIKVDGIIGKGTTSYALLVLNNIGRLDPGTVGGTALAYVGQISEPETLAAFAQQVVDLLVLATKPGQSAVASQATPAAPLSPPQNKPTTTQLVTTPANVPPKTTSPATQQAIDAIKAAKPKLATSLFDRVPPWAAYVSGAALAVGALVAVLTISKRRKAAAPAPVAGRWAGW